MRYTKWTFSGRDYYLSYNGMAMYQINDIGIEDLADILAEHTVAAFNTICRVAEIMVQQGELVRRYLGYDAGNTIDADSLRVVLTPKEDSALRDIIMQAVLEGFRTETDGKDGVDLGLLELQKKTETD